MQHLSSIKARLTSNLETTASLSRHDASRMPAMDTAQEQNACSDKHAADKLRRLHPAPEANYPKQSQALPFPSRIPSKQDLCWKKTKSGGVQNY